MSRRRCSSVLAPMLLLALAGVPRATAGVVVPLTGPRDRWAVLVGVDSPGAQLVAPLKRIANLLRTEYGYRAENVVEIYGAGATLDGIRGHLERMQVQIKAVDTLFIVVALPSARVGEDIVAVPEGGDPLKPWTVVSLKDVGSWLGRVTSRQALAVIPACSYSKQSAYILDELRYSRGPQTSLQVLTVCDEGGDQTAEVLNSIEDLLTNAEGRIEARQMTGQIVGRLPRTVAVFSAGGMSDIAFTFARERNRLLPLVDTVARGSTSEARVRAIHDIVDAIDSEQPERRSALIDQAGATLTQVTGDADRAVRLASVWAIGEIAYVPAAASLANRFAAAADDEERRQIVFSLSNLGGDRAFEVISRGLDDRSADVRIATLRAAAALNDTAVATRIATLAGSDTDPKVRVAALRVLPSLQVDPLRRIDQTKRAFADTDVTVRRQAALTWGELGQSPADSAVLAILANKGEDAGVRQTIAFAFGRTPASLNEEPVELLTAILLSNDTASVREAAAWSLGKSKSDSARQALTRTVVKQSDPASVRVAAADALGGMKRPEIVRALLQALKKSTSPEVRVAAAKALGEIADPLALSGLLDAVSDPDPYVRTQAVVAVNKINPEAGSVGTLIAALRDPAPAVRAQAAQRLAKAAGNAPQASRALVARLDDPDATVRRAVTIALTELSNAATKQAVTEALKSPDPHTREGAIIVIGNVPFSDLADPIASIATDLLAPSSVRAEAVRALGRMRANPAIALKAAEDRDPAVREAAIDALLLARSADAVEALKRLSADHAPLVRDKAIAALRSLPAGTRRD